MQQALVALAVTLPVQTQAAARLPAINSTLTANSTSTVQVTCMHSLHAGLVSCHWQRIQSFSRLDSC
jgi:hypothetical protein